MLIFFCRILYKNFNAANPAKIPRVVSNKFLTQAVREHRLTPLNHLMFEFQYYQSRIRRGGPTKILCWPPRLGSATPFPRRRGWKSSSPALRYLRAYKTAAPRPHICGGGKNFGTHFQITLPNSAFHPRSFSGGNGVTAPLLCDPRLVVSAFFYRNDRGVQMHLFLFV